MVRVVALDETGNFESREADIRFVCCVVADTENYEKSKRELEEKLKDICDRFNVEKCKSLDYKVIYPNSLHSSDIVFEKEYYNGRERKTQIVSGKDYLKKAKEFREYMTSNVMEYIKEKQYKICLFWAPNSNDGIVGEFDTNIIDVRYGANLYERMAILSIYNQIFYTMESEPGEYYFDIATRTLETSIDLENMYETYEKRGGETRLSNITNTSTYKTAIATMIYEKNIATKAKYNFSVKSINYNANDKNDTTPFTYMADIVCGYIRKKCETLVGVKKLYESEDFSKIVSGLKKECKLELSIYTEVEATYRKVVEALKQMDLVDCYSYMYDLEHSKDKYREYYRKLWLQLAHEELKTRLKNNEKFREVFRKRIMDFIHLTEGYMGIREELYDKGLYITEKLLKIVLEYDGEFELKNTVLFRLNDIMIRGLNHQGDVKCIKQNIKMCDKFKAYVNVEEYVEHVLRVVEYYFNIFDFEGALSAIESIEKSAIELKKVYASLYRVSGEITQSILEIGNPVQSSRLTLLGKIYSNMGQAKAFLGKYEEAENAFMKALAEFEEDSVQYKIVLCHYLHLLVQHKKDVLYKNWAPRYFGSTSLSGQLENAFKREDGYAAFLFIKAFKTFYVNDYSNDSVMYKIVDKVSNVKKDGQHPWELIYKNVYECICARGWQDREGMIEFASKSQNCVDTAHFTLLIIQINAKLEMIEEMYVMEEKTAVEGLGEREKNACKQLLEIEDDIIYYGSLKAKLKEKLTYEYV